MKTAFSLVGAAFLGINAIVHAQEFQGASALLQRLAEDASKTAADPSGDSPAGRLRADLAKFPPAASALLPRDAAAQWLSLVDRFAALTREEQESQSPGRPYRRRNGFDYEAVFAALPPPAAWPELLKAIEARPRESGRKALLNAVLKLLGHTLVNDANGRWTSAAELREVLSRTPHLNDPYAERMMRSALLEIDPDPRQIVADFTERLAAWEQADEQPRVDELFVPNLAALTDEATAASLLERALVLPLRDGITIVDGRATKALARNLTLKLIPKMKLPPWRVLDSLDSVELFEAMRVRFPFGKFDDYSGKQTALSFYLIGLVAADRTAEALKVLATLDAQTKHKLSLSSGLDELVKSGRGSMALPFLREWLARYPESEYRWGDFMFLCQRLGLSEVIRTNLTAAIQRQDVPPRIRLKLRSELASALLAADRIEEGVEQLRVISSGPSPRRAAASTRPQSRGRKILDRGSAAGKPRGRKTRRGARGVASTLP